MVSLDAGDTFKLNFPSRSVIVAFCVPDSRTAAPMTVSPVLSLTIPETWIFCSCPWAGKMGHSSPNDSIKNIRMFLKSGRCPFVCFSICKIFKFIECFC